ncbi:(4Fe-4S)-binding protein [Sphingobacterium detergens]|uniref:Putative Fe-S cluster protein YjdI n=1 Tax=Sphingobacterium detergens TaxID=1145106 RepID=A0A420ARI7_SPHD1|nr:(4Fe-4S)-binding protein [Sphingobacterium detergens]RKE47091.1 putative Fe-S cluster protein YjdI [Sphingobacterium detergens]
METKEYSKNKNITILWTPSKCIHAGICVKSLPEVYHPKETPWITPEGASVEKLKEQIDKCPTGALGYRIDKNTG